MRAADQAATRVFIAGLTCETRDRALERWLNSLADGAPTSDAVTGDHRVSRWERDPGPVPDLIPGAVPCWSLRSVSGSLRHGQAFFRIPEGAVWIDHASHVRVFGDPRPGDPGWQDLLLAGVFELAAAAGGLALHAAVLEWNTCGLLVAAPAGAGKSTFTYCAALAGARYSCDDVALVWRSEAGWHAHGFGAGIRVYPHTRATADGFVAVGGPEPDGKIRLAPADDHARRTDRAAIQRLVLLRPQHGEASVWRTCGPGEALTRVLEHVALALTPTVAARQLELVRLLAELPGLELETGRDLLESPAVLGRRILDRACHA